MASLSKDYLKIMELLIDAEMKMFKGINTPVIFLQNVITDLLLGLGMTDVLVAYHDYVQKKYNAEAGFITMNLPKLLETLEGAGVKNPIICASINKAGFRMSGGKERYEEILETEPLQGYRHAGAGGWSGIAERSHRVCLPPAQYRVNPFWCVFKTNINETVSLIRQFDKEVSHPIEERPGPTIEKP
ncbi:MAG: hypothetical protein MZV64_01665 [Ignavibacteriales bacterium]|nr:hypothetical protein [Ignavibacteriales bacterium]